MTPQSALLSARLVSENYFEVLGISAVLGRTFLPEEVQLEKSNPAALLSYQFRRQRVTSTIRFAANSRNGDTLSELAVSRMDP